MSESSKHIEVLLQYLNANCRYALLRNFEGLPHSTSSRDIDIIISRREYKTHRREIVAQLTQNGWRILSHIDNGRLITFVVAQLREGGVNIVQWDFFTDTSVHGITLLTSEELLASRTFNGFLYHISKEYEFLDKYLYNRAVGADYPAKYSSVREAVKGSDIVERKLTQLFGVGSLETIDKRRGLLFSAFWRGLLRSPLRALSSVLNSVWRQTTNYLFVRSSSPVLSFSGADGVGKSTIIQTIKEMLSPVYGNATCDFHFRPALIANLGEVACSAGIKKSVNREFDKPHRAARVSTLSSLCRLCYYTFDYVLGYWLKVRPQARATRLVIFDRYYGDLIVDSSRSAINLSVRFLYGWGRFFIPQVRYNFLITAKVDTILARKQELTREEIGQINSNMEYLASKPTYHLICNDGSVEKAVMEILDILLEGQHKYKGPSNNINRVR